MEKAVIIKSETEAIIKKLIDNFEIEVKEEDGIFNIVIKTEEEASTIIGRHGETIRSIQKILEVIFYKRFGQPVNILVNVNDYREKQRERLEKQASEFAEKTKKTKEASYISGLSSYQRKTIHEYITKNYPDLTTFSVGAGKNRKLVIDFKGNKEVIQ